MRIIPVLDLMGGLVVRGRGGRRKKYQPIVSKLTPSAHPLDVARAFRDRFGLAELYLADLDAIGGAPPALPVYEMLRREGFRLLVDAGLRETADAASLAAEVDGLVAGLETLASPTVLAELCRTYGNERLLFSLDLNEGRPLVPTAAWAGSEPWRIAAQAVACGARRVLVLDLARVGAEGGTGTEELCFRLAATYSEVEILAGGGVRGREDLERLRQGGVRGALVASALHDGRLVRDDWERGSEPR